MVNIGKLVRMKEEQNPGISFKKKRAKKKTREPNWSSPRASDKNKQLGKKIYVENVTTKCRNCGTQNKSAAYIMTECSKMAQEEYKK